MLYQNELETIKELLENGVDEQVIIDHVVDKYLEDHCRKVRFCDDFDRDSYEYLDTDWNEASDAAQWGIEKMKQELSLL